MTEATAYANEIAQAENDKALWKRWSSRARPKFYKLTDAERKAWIDAARPVHKEMAGRIGKDLLSAIYAATGSDLGK